MALGKKRIIAQKSNSKQHRRDVDDGGLGIGLEFTQYKKGFGRKRILISGGDDIGDSIFNSPVRKTSSRKLTSVANGQIQELEDLPQDILVMIICGVDHEDLKQLFHVSKTIREATLIAKDLHFAYNTPRKTSVFRGLEKPFGLGGGDIDDEIEAPGAPLQKRHRFSRFNRDKDDSGVSVALFN